MILERFGMQEAKPASTPIATGTKLVKFKDNDEIMDQKLYQSIIGSEMYAILCAQPDIGYAVQQMSQHSAQPMETHLKVAKHTLRYLKGTTAMRITYGKNSGRTEVHGFCDADHASDEDRKSISEYVFMFNGGAISRQAKKQQTIALSSTEAQYNALTQAAKEALWL